MQKKKKIRIAAGRLRIKCTDRWSNYANHEIHSDDVSRTQNALYGEFLSSASRAGKYFLRLNFYVTRYMVKYISYPTFNSVLKSTVTMGNVCQYEGN